MNLFFILGPILVSSNENVNHHHPEHPHKPTLLPAHAPAPTHHSVVHSTTESELIDLAPTEEPIPKEKTCIEGFKLACEKCFEKEVSIAIGFHAKKHLINHHGQVKRLLDEKEEQKIRETLARELSPDSSFQVCVTEGQYHPSHNKEDNMIEIPLHVYGNGTETESQVENIIIEHAIANGSEFKINSTSWPEQAFLLRVADQSIEEIKQKRAARGRRWVWPTIFILLALSIFIILYVRGSPLVHRLFCCKESRPGRLIVS